MKTTKEGKRSLFIILVLLLIACQAEVDKSGSLGGGYKFRADGGMTWISGENVYDESIPGNITDYASDQTFIIAKQIPSKNYYHYFFSSELASRYRYLLYNEEVIDNPNEKHKRFMKNKWWLDTEIKNRMTRYVVKDNHDNTEAISQLVDSVLNNDPEYKKIFFSKLNYWILIKDKNQLYGPYSEEQFYNRRIELSVPKELQFGD